MGSCCPNGQEWQRNALRSVSVLADAGRASTIHDLPTEVGALRGSLLRLGVDFADHDFGAIERKAVEFVVKTLAVAMRPQSTNRSPDLFVAILGDGVDAVRLSIGLQNIASRMTVRVGSFSTHLGASSEAGALGRFDQRLGHHGFTGAGRRLAYQCRERRFARG
jgi:hypothetical protein